MTDFAKTKALFQLPKGVIYLDGNSLGPPPLAVGNHVGRAITNEWGELLITGWIKAGWMKMSTALGDRVGGLIGAAPGSVILGDTLSIKVYQALASALDLNPSRKIILSDTGNFPSDLYMAQGLIKSLKQGHELRTVAPEDVAGALTEDVAVLMLTEVDYKTGRKHDMKALTELAHSIGVITVWDLAHSAGAIPVDLTGAGADFAIGCTYKFLNGGPGAPAFIYVAPRHIKQVRPALSGWLGHEAPFDFDLDYRAGIGIDRMRVGTPPVLGLKALESALDIWDMVDIGEVRVRSIELCDLFIAEMRAHCPDVPLASPVDGNERGSQVCFFFDLAEATILALTDLGVIGDFRAPNVLRFGITPLYIDEGDIKAAVAIIAKVINGNLWDDPAYRDVAAIA